MPRRALHIGAAAAVLLMLAGGAQAKTCRDAAGKFTACPAPAASAHAGRCRSANGQFTKCPAPAAAVTPTSQRAAAPTGVAANTSAIGPVGPRGAASARCRDGSMSFSQHRAGTCAGHGGVGAWLTQR